MHALLRHKRHRLGAAPLCFQSYGLYRVRVKIGYPCFTVRLILETAGFRDFKLLKFTWGLEYDLTSLPPALYRHTGTPNGKGPILTFYGTVGVVDFGNSEPGYLKIGVSDNH